MSRTARARPRPRGPAARRRPSAPSGARAARGSRRRTRAAARARARPARAAAARRSARSGTRASARRAAPARARRGRRSGDTACRCRRRRGTPRPPSRRRRSRARRRAPPPPRGSARGCARRRRGPSGPDPFKEREFVHCGNHAPAPPSISASRSASAGSASESSSVNAPSAMPTGSSVVEHVGARGLQRLAHLGLRPDGAEQPGAGPDHRARLVPQHVLGERARGPVDRVLQRAGQRRVVLRRRDQQRVRVLDRGQELAHRFRRRVLEVLVEGGQARESVPLHQLDSRAGAARPPPGATCGCGILGAGCRRCRGSARASPA